MDLVKLVHQEEYKGTSGGSWSVELRRNINVLFSYLSDLDLLLNLSRELLGELKRLNKGNIFKNISLSLSELLEESTLELLQLDLKSILLLDELLLLGGKIWSLLLDDEGKKLVLKTILCDSEVDQCALSLDLWWIMRVRQLGVQEQVEFRVQGKFLVSHFDVLGLTLLDDGSGVNGLDNCVNRVLHVFNKHWVSVFDRLLNGLWHFWVG